MIATLSYFGVLNPSKVLPGRCTIAPEFQCLDYQIVQTGAAPNPQLKVKVRSNFGEPIDVTAFSISKDDGSPLSCTANSTISGWKTGEVKDLAWTSCASTGWTAGTKMKVLISLRYNSVASGSGYGNDIPGEVYANVI